MSLTEPHLPDFPRRSQAIAVALGLAAAGVVSLMGFFIGSNGGFPSRVNAQALAMSSLEVMWEWECPEAIEFPGLEYSKCVFGSPWANAHKKAILWGDSHAEHLAPYVHQAAVRAGYSVLLARETEQAGCPPVIDNQKTFRRPTDEPLYSEKCAAQRQAILTWLAKNPEVETVLVAGAWPNLARVIEGADEGVSGADLIQMGLQDLAAAAPGKTFVFLGDVAQWNLDPAPCVYSRRSGILRIPCPEPVLDLSMHELHAPVANAVKQAALNTPNATSLDPTDGMCAETCITEVNGEFLYRDDGHLRRNVSDQTAWEAARLMGLPKVFDVSAKRSDS